MKITIPIRTERLVIRELHQDDWRPLHAMVSEPSLAERREEMAVPEAVKRHVEEVIALQDSPSRCSYELAVCAAETGEFVGEADLGFMPGSAEAEIGIVLVASSHGRGFGAEICRALIGLAFGPLKLRRVVGYCDPANASSRRMMEKARMRLEDERSVFDHLMNRWRDACIYVIERG